MYGLERFGDFLIKMSKSKHKHKHVSIVKKYVWVELETFLMVHDPVKYAGLVEECRTEPHVFSFTTVQSPQSWVVSGRASRIVVLPPDDVMAISNLYQTLPLSVNISGMIDVTALQIPGTLWSGFRHFSMYYEGYHHYKLGKGNCCVSWPVGNSKLENYGGQCYGITRNIIKHKAYGGSSSCPSVFFFSVELLRVKSPPGNCDLPLLLAEPTSQRVWLSQLDIVSAANNMFCLRDHDDIPDCYYLIELIS